MPWHCFMRSKILGSLHFPIPETCSRLPIEKRSLVEHLPKIVLGHGKVTFTRHFLSFSYFSVPQNHKNFSQYSLITNHMFFLRLINILHLYIMLFFHAFSSPCSSSIFPFSVFSFLRSTETTCYVLAPTTLLSYSLLMEVKLCCHGHKHFKC